ncbi:hypothetical protein [Streptomyces sp. NPDC046985]
MRPAGRTNTDPDPAPRKGVNDMSDRDFIETRDAKQECSKW